MTFCKAYNLSEFLFLYIQVNNKYILYIIMKQLAITTIIELFNLI